LRKIWHKIGCVNAVCIRTSRWHLAQEAFSFMVQQGVIDSKTSMILNDKYRQKFVDHTRYIRQYVVDPDDIAKWQWLGE
jgi:xylulose-5-phosphate/fructose-6-phosphate phosphoketolase